jgi:hypothetical protein
MTVSQAVPLPPHGAYGVVIRSFILTLFLIITVVGSFGLGRVYGAHWGILPFDLLVICWAVASLYDVKQVCGVRIWRLTLTDIIVLLAICCVMHGVAMPAVQTQCQLRRLPAPSGPAIPQVPLSSTDGDSGTDSPKYRPIVARQSPPLQKYRTVGVGPRRGGR